MMAEPKTYFYRNLHKEVWSGMERGRVVCRHKHITLWNVEFRVRPAGARRARAERKKNVHAFAVVNGQSDCDPWCHDFDDYDIFLGYEEVTYSPFKATHFFRVKDGSKVSTAREVALLANGKMFAREIT